MSTPAPIPVPSPRTLRVLADLADGERLKDIATREGVTVDALYRRLHRAGRGSRRPHRARAARDRDRPGVDRPHLRGMDRAGPLRAQAGRWVRVNRLNAQWSVRRWRGPLAADAVLMVAAITAGVAAGLPWVAAVAGLASLPDGAAVTARAIHACTVAVVSGGYFSARTKGRRVLDRHPLSLVPAADRRLVRPGARFWLLAETVRGEFGQLEGRSAIRFKRDGLSVEAAFARDTQTRTP